MARTQRSPNQQLTEIPITDIEVYEHNPRRSKNPEYERIKESLALNGFETPLLVTKKPGEPKFTLFAGGNTRLDIAQTLHRSGDRKFESIPCVIKDWTNESSVLVAHLRENDLRGDLTFIDRALAVHELASLIKPVRKKRLSQRDLEVHLHKQGYSISQPVVASMLYVVKRLYPHMPKALENGLGRRQVNLIRAIDNSTSRVWQTCCHDADVSYDSVFTGLVSRLDDLSFDIDALLKSVAHEIAMFSEYDQNAVLLMIEAERTGAKVQLKEYEVIAVDTSRKHELEPTVHRSVNVEKKLSKFRHTLVRTAIVLANQFALSQCVEVTPGKRFGYFLKEFPITRASKLQLAIWKLLATCCEQGRFRKQKLLEEIEVDSRMAKALTGKSILQAHKSLQSTDLLEIDRFLLPALNDEDWQSVVQLMSTYRNMRLFATEHQHDL